MREMLKNAVRLAVTQFFVITVCVMFVISASNALFTDVVSFPLDWSFPWVMMLTGLLGALPSFILVFKNEPTKKQFYRRLAIHFLAIEAVILIEGYILRWYTTFSFMLVVALMVAAVYAMVFLLSHLYEKHKVKNINNALQNFNSDEEAY